MTRTVPLLILAGLAAACPGDAPKSDPRALQAVMAALDRNLSTLQSFVLEGTAHDGATEVKLTYAWAQPQYARAELTSAAGAQTLIFDGQALLILDHAAKAYARVDKTQGEERLLLALHQAFAEISVEGWRPPLLKPKVTTATTSADGKQFLLTSPIEDAELKEERLSLRAPDGAFLQKVTVDKEGRERAATRVLEHLVDPTTGMTLPKRWERVRSPAEGPAERFEVTLHSARVNVGASPESFQTAIPAGYESIQ